MGRKRGVITAAVLCMDHQAFIQNPCLQIRVCAVISEHPENVLRRGEIFARIADNQRPVIVIMLIGVIIIHGNQGHDPDQEQRLAQNIRDRCIVRSFVIGIKSQDRPLHAVHDVGAGGLHDYVADKLRRQFPVLGKKGNKFSQFFFIRKVAEQEQVSDLFKIEAAVMEAADQITDLISLKIELAFDGNGYAVHILMSVDVRDLRKPGQDAPSV